MRHIIAEMWRQAFILFLQASPALLALIVPEIWRNVFDWLRQSRYWGLAQGLCILWIIMVIAYQLPSSIKTSRNQTTIVASIFGAAIFGVIAWFYMGMPNATTNNDRYMTVEGGDIIQPVMLGPGINPTIHSTSVGTVTTSNSRPPYLTLRVLRFDGGFSGKQIIQVEIINRSSSLTAFNVVYSFAVKLQPSDPEFFGIQPTLHGSLAPKTSFLSNGADLNARYDPEILSQLDSGENAFWIYGKISYSETSDDQIKHERWYCYFYNKDLHTDRMHSLEF